MKLLIRFNITNYPQVVPPSLQGTLLRNYGTKNVLHYLRLSQNGFTLQSKSLVITCSHCPCSRSNFNLSSETASNNASRGDFSWELKSRSLRRLWNSSLACLLLMLCRGVPCSNWRALNRVNLS